MNRKLNNSHLLLITALVLGAIFRFWPSVTNGFPTLDGGMFYVMARELRANHFILPQFTTYNHENIPYAYPPLGFYLAALLSLLTPTSELWIFLYIPALISMVSIFAFYKLAKEVFCSDMPASLATLVFALSSRAFLWEVMGGGITRSLGKLFLLLMMWQAVHLFHALQQSMHSYQISNDYPKLSEKYIASEETLLNKHTLLVIIFGAGVILSHPPAALHAVLGGLLIFIFHGRSIRSLMASLWICVGIVLLATPWLNDAISPHGIQPFVYAAQTSKHSLENYLTILNLYIPTTYIIIPTLFFLYLGLWYSLKRHEYFIITWIVIIYMIDTRGAEFVAPLAESMLTGVGIFGFLTWIDRSKNKPDNNITMGRLSQIVMIILTLYFTLTATSGDFQLLNSSLKPEDLNMIGWVNNNIDKNKSFLLITGHKFSMSDPLQEWFPALTDQHSIATLQGMEWIKGANFFPWLEQLTLVQQCTNIGCVDNWRTHNNVRYDYLIVTDPKDADSNESAISLRSLLNSMSNSDAHVLIHQSPNSLIFKFIK